MNVQIEELRSLIPDLEISDQAKAALAQLADEADQLVRVKYANYEPITAYVENFLSERPALPEDRWLAEEVVLRWVAEFYLTLGEDKFEWLVENVEPNERALVQKERDGFVSRGRKLLAASRRARTQTWVEQAQRRNDAKNLREGSDARDHMLKGLRRFAMAQLTAVWAFRVLTIGLVGLATVLSVFPDWLPGWSVGTEQSFWARLATTVLISGLAAYFGRLSAQHRRTYLWLKILMLQIRVFPSFSLLGPEERRGDVYAILAAKAFGAPVESRGDSKESASVVSQFASAVADSLKRANTPV